MHKTEQSYVDKLEGTLDDARFSHSIRVQQLAIELSVHHNVDREKASIAGLLHDCSRYLSSRQLLSKAEEVGLHVEPIMRFEPKLLHAPLSGYFAKMEYGIDDPEIITAIERHTIGSPVMTALDKIIYIADHAEPERDFNGIEEIRRIMKKDLNGSISLIASCMIRYLIEKEMPIHPLTLETRNYHLRKAKRLW